MRFDLLDTDRGRRAEPALLGCADEVLVHATVSGVLAVQQATAPTSLKAFTAVQDTLQVVEVDDVAVALAVPLVEDLLHLESLLAHGVEVVFGIPGNHNLAIYEHLNAAGIKHVLARHEQGCVFAAEGYARVSGKPGVALVTGGPAVLNCLAALSQSYADSIPVLLVSPGMPLRHPQRGNGLLHETKDQHSAVDAIVAYSHRVTSVEEVGKAVSQAFVDMTAGRPRPVHIEVPYDVLDESAVADIGFPVRTPTSVAPQDQILAAARSLLAAQRPGIVVGGGARLAAPEILQLAERLGAAVVSSTNGKGILPEDHPLSLGAGAHLSVISEWVSSRDVIIAVGTDLGGADLWNGPWQIDGEFIRIDIDPRQIVVNGRPDISLVGDAAATLDALLAVLGAHEPVTSEAGDQPARWAARVHAEASAESALWLDEIEAISRSISRDAIVAGDSAAVCYYGLRASLPLYSPGAFLYPTGSGTLGYGLPAAVGAKVAAPQRDVVAVLGDGGIMFTLAELATAAAEGLSIPVIIVDNGGYGQIRTNMKLRGNESLGVDFPSPDFAALGVALGCHGVTIDSPEHLAAELSKALRSDRPTVLHVIEKESE